MPNSDLKLLGEKVRTERKLAGLTQEQLAERCHVSTKHIANIEKGSMNPSYEILLAIARVLPVSLDALITPGMGKTEIELKEFNRIYLSCPEAVRETLMDSIRTLAKHLTEFTVKLKIPENVLLVVQYSIFFKVTIPKRTQKQTNFIPIQSIPKLT